MSAAQRLTARPDIAGTVAGLFIPGRSLPSGPGAVGLELELIPVTRDASGRPRRLPIHRVEELVASAGAEVRTLGHISYEPGGQLELSPDCEATARQAVDTALRLVGALRASAAGSGIHLLACGADPWTPAAAVGLQLDRPRYRGLQAQFDRVGPWGRRMMRTTAALQVCLDLGHGDAAAERWRLLHHAGPPLLAALANSPAGDGALADAVSLRSLTWQRADPSRTGFGGVQVDNPLPGYTELTLDAEVIGVPGDSASGLEPGPAPGTTLRDWLAVRGDRPDATDIEHHLSTLFPPVRPRGYLEVRYLDALPMELVGVAVALLAVLTEDRWSRHRALEAVAGDPRPWPERWRTAAVDGLADPLHRHLAVELVTIAGEGAPRLPDGYLPHGCETGLAALAEQIAAGRCPADDRREAFVRDPQEVASWT